MYNRKRKAGISLAKVMYIIIIVAFLDTFIQLPIITPYALELGASYTLTGSIVAVYSFTNMIGNIIGGHWIDNFGRKKMLFTGMISVCIIFVPIVIDRVAIVYCSFLPWASRRNFYPRRFCLCRRSNLRKNTWQSNGVYRSKHRYCCNSRPGSWRGFSSKGFY